MMNIMIWIVLGLLIFFGVVAIVVARKRGRRPTDYYAFYVMGITWLPFGIVMKLIFPDAFIGSLFMTLGLIYLAIGLVNKDKWKKNRRKMSREEMKLKMWIVLGLGLLVLIGLVFFYLGADSEKLIGGDKDSHGCLVAAGYSWNETEEACVMEWVAVDSEDRYQIVNFQQCIDAGYPAMESYPRQCRAGERVFVEDVFLE